MKQYSRNRNIEIKGVPAAKAEALSTILKQLGDAISEPITEAHVDSRHRVPIKNDGCPNIVASSLLG